jgi:glyoxylase-like metal-dependent hydrolase (beta-lactamase superfamily II)
VSEPDVVAAVAQRGFFGGGDPVEIAPRTLFVPTLANSASLLTDEGIVMVDCGVRLVGPQIHAAVRAWTDAPLHTVVFSHGHLDHCFGLDPWYEAGDDPRIVAHENVPKRFLRYLRTGPLNEHINNVQFGFEDVKWESRFFWPTTTYRDALTIAVGGERFELRHGKGETDDGTWLWAPERGVLCTGDFWISCVPNCGNPQKVQRYPEEWADALEAMAVLDAEVLLPGHGAPITGAATVKQALTDVAAYLRSLVEQTIAGLNAGLTHEEVVARVEPAADLAGKPYLQPAYDRPEFIVRNVIRRHAGWWDGHPANLMPASSQRQAEEIAALAGGVNALVERARALADTDLPLACHLAEWAAVADPSDRSAQEAVRDLFRMRADGEPSLMGRGIFMHAVRQAKRALGD